MNQKGQALTEGLILGSLIATSIFYVMRIGFSIQQNMILNELIEMTLVDCLQDSKNCTKKLEEHLRKLHFKKIQISLDQTTQKQILNVQAQSDFGIHFFKESELDIDLQVN